MTDATCAVLAEPFRLLARSESRRELGLVADALRQAGGEIAEAASNYGDELVAIAEASGCGGLTALDLAVAVEFGVKAPRRNAPAVPPR